MKSRFVVMFGFGMFLVMGLLYLSTASVFAKEDKSDLPPKKWTLRRVSGIIAADLKTREVSNGRSREQEAAV